jgi:hypothetical protein
MREFKRRNGELFAGLKRLQTSIPLLALIAIGVSGCSFSVALPSFLNDDETSSIKPKSSPLSDSLDESDWGIARPALAKAMVGLDSQPPVAWSNPDTGRGGLFQSVGVPFTRNGRQCRAFVAGLSIHESKTMIQGVACLADNGEVALDGVGPWKGQ